MEEYRNRVRTTCWKTSVALFAAGWVSAWLISQRCRFGMFASNVTGKVSMSLRGFDSVAVGAIVTELINEHRFRHALSMSTNSSSCRPLLIPTDLRRWKRLRGSHARQVKAHWRRAGTQLESWSMMFSSISNGKVEWKGSSSCMTLDLSGGDVGVEEL